MFLDRLKEDIKSFTLFKQGALSDDRRAIIRKDLQNPCAQAKNYDLEFIVMTLTAKSADSSLDYLNNVIDEI